MVDARGTDPVGAIRDLCGGVDYAFEALGRERTIQQAWRSLDVGGEVIVVGLMRHGATLTIDANPLVNEQGIRGCYFGSSHLMRDVPALVARYLAGELLLDELISQRIGLDGLGDAFDRMRVGVMSAGRLQQIAPPAELYERPRTAFVAEFVGLTNRLPGTVADGERVRVLDATVPTLPGSVASGTATVLVRPESVLVMPDAGGNGHVVAATFLGSLCRVEVELDSGTTVLAQVSSAEVTALAPGTRVRVSVHPTPALALELD